ncbi:Protein of unknown function [Enhydrobacter aerosaccus]|uniref:DUF3987 domain-containing protein n=1 Tax=Enhydrobacter aerosaccus TaxID=225324 RepID=A0A1T4LWQ4_9HYPH|nr:DUF3987 domain-containing protein [Enhydrobacter aerosaccus]SJZ59180.1 Protein of unknown function [Enhydrobacter aerosaccus]
MPLSEPDTLPASIADWPPLDRALLGETHPALPTFPLHLFPTPWRAWVEASSRLFGSADYLTHCLLGGVAAVGGAGLRIEVAAHWREPLLLWQALVGGPSSGKSASFARVRALLAAVTPHAESGDRAAPTVVFDGGLERVDTALLGSSRGVLLWRENLADWMAEANARGRRQDRRPARPAWLAGWSAGSSLVGPRPRDDFAVGIAGALSPERLAAWGEGDRALASRFLYVWPQRGAAPSLADGEADDSGLVALLQKIASLAGHRETPCVVPFDEDAARRLEALMPALQRPVDEREEPGAEGVAAEWIGRGVPTLVRLAGLLSLMEWSLSKAEWSPVRATHVEAAYELWSGYYRPHALAVFDRSEVGACEHAARRVARWLRRVRVSQISREDVRREALCQSVDVEGAEEVLARLEAVGLVRQLPPAGSSRGGPRRRRWLVHPQLAGRASEGGS